MSKADSSEEESQELEDEDELEADKVLVKLGRRSGSKVDLEGIRAIENLVRTSPPLG